MTETFHLTPREVWESQAAGAAYLPEPFSQEGFIHCTDGRDNVIVVGNRYYRNDRRSYLCLVIDLERVNAPIKFDDEARIYPHIYGPLNIDAVVRIQTVARSEDGTFLALDD